MHKKIQYFENTIIFTGNEVSLKMMNLLTVTDGIKDAISITWMQIVYKNSRFPLIKKEANLFWQRGTRHPITEPLDRRVIVEAWTLCTAPGVVWILQSGALTTRSWPDTTMISNNGFRDFKLIWFKFVYLSSNCSYIVSCNLSWTEIAAWLELFIFFVCLHSYGFGHCFDCLVASKY